TSNWAAGLVGGVIIGFNPLTQVMIEGQINVASLQWFLLCIEFYLRAWSGGGRRDAILTGVFFSLAVLTVGYFEVLLLFFVAVHLLWALLTGSSPGFPARIGFVAARARPLLAWGGLAALVFLGPFLVGAWASLQKGQTVLTAGGDEFKTEIQSA